MNEYIKERMDSAINKNINTNPDISKLIFVKKATKSINNPVIIRNLPAKICVFFQTLSFSIVHGVRMPITKLGLILGNWNPNKMNIIEKIL